MDVYEALLQRRSVRKYTGESIPEESLKKICNAALLAPTSKNTRSGEFILVRDKDTLNKLSAFRDFGSQILAGADAAVVVLGNKDKADAWVEDCSIAMAYMHLTAESLGVGSCWLQGRLRNSGDGRTSEEMVRELLRFPENFCLEAILALGMPDKHPAPHTEDELLNARFHTEKY